MNKDTINWETHTGEALMVGDVTVTPQSQALSVRWPNGGFVWNRPVAVVVQHGEQSMRLPIFDVTRIAQIGFFGLSAFFITIFMILSLKRRR